MRVKAACMLIVFCVTDALTAQPARNDTKAKSKQVDLKSSFAFDPSKSLHVEGIGVAQGYVGGIGWESYNFAHRDIGHDHPLSLNGVSDDAEADVSASPPVQCSCSMATGGGFLSSHYLLEARREFIAVSGSSQGGSFGQACIYDGGEDCDENLCSACACNAGGVEGLDEILSYDPNQPGVGKQLFIQLPFSVATSCYVEPAISRLSLDWSAQGGVALASSDFYWSITRAENSEVVFEQDYHLENEDGEEGWASGDSGSIVPLILCSGDYYLNVRYTHSSSAFVAYRGSGDSDGNGSQSMQGDYSCASSAVNALDYFELRLDQRAFSQGHLEVVDPIVVLPDNDEGSAPENLVEKVQAGEASEVRILEDWGRLAAEGRVVQGLAADGATRTFLRLELAEPVGRFGIPVTFSIRDELGQLGTEGGSLSAVNGSSEGSAATVAPVAVGGNRYFAFAEWRAPLDFVRHGNNDGEISKRNVTLSASIGDCPVAQELVAANFILARPAVLLLHRLWGSANDWELAMKDDPRFPVTFSQDYGDSQRWNSGPLQDYVSKAREGARTARDLLREREKVAATQVDALGHHAGGLILRFFSTDVLGNYERIDNFLRGDEHKLITVNSPHKGSKAADKLIQFLNDPAWSAPLRNFMDSRGIPPEFGGLEDLQTVCQNQSGPIASMGASAVPSHAIVSTGGLTVDSQGDLGFLRDSIDLNLVSAIDFVSDWQILQPLAYSNGVFEGQAVDHDVWADADSQMGGLGGGSYGGPNAISVFHYLNDTQDRTCGEMIESAENCAGAANPCVNETIVELLNASAVTDENSLFAPGFPANRCGSSSPGGQDESADAQPGG